jgi:DNA polymerase III delta prime subunit
MWVTKYAPQSFTDVVGNKDIVERFERMCETGYMQHMILCGPSGVGKNTLLHLLMRGVLGDKYKDGTLLFTSYENKSNQHVRDKIHQFVPKKMSHKMTKFVVFKQAELLSDGVQQVMRRLMEQHYHHTVFVFVCNSIGNLLETIQSRCHIYRFRYITPSGQEKRLLHIAQQENFDVDQPSIKQACTRISGLSNGNMRFCLNYFQVYCASGVDLCESCLFPYYKNVQQLFTLLLDTNAPKSVAGFHQCVGYLRELVNKGYCGRDVVTFMNDYIIANDASIPRHIALEWLKNIALCQHRMANGTDSFLQICRLVSVFYACTLDTSTETETKQT